MVVAQGREAGQREGTWAVAVGHPQHAAAVTPTPIVTVCWLVAVQCSDADKVCKYLSYSSERLPKTGKCRSY